MPVSVCVEEWLDRDEILDHADLVVCHARSRTAFGALAAGVPPVMFPLFAHKFENARRITDAAAGITIEIVEDTIDRSCPPCDTGGEREIVEVARTVPGEGFYRQRARCATETDYRVPALDIA